MHKFFFLVVLFSDFVMSTLSLLVQSLCRENIKANICIYQKEQQQKNIKNLQEEGEAEEEEAKKNEKEEEHHHHEIGSASYFLFTEKNNCRNVNMPCFIRFEFKEALKMKT